MTATLQTPLGKWHYKNGAKMAPFAGWDMPIQYSGIIQEHTHTRTSAAIFDICHMGEFMVSGDKAAEALSLALTSNTVALKIGRCSYGFLLNDAGGILDDLITYRLAEDKFMLVVNAANRRIDYQTLQQRLPAGVLLEDISDRTGKIDLQGPLSRQVLEETLPGKWTELKYFGFCQGKFQNSDILISRTGYTGELGYEIYLPAELTLTMWELLLGNPLVKPAGLGARDTLRLEAGLPLGGQEHDPDHTPAELGYAAMLASPAAYAGKQGAFTRREALIPMTIQGRRSARHGNAVLNANGEQIGVITSGSFSPSLGCCIALAYIKAEEADQIKTRQDEQQEQAKYTVQADRASLEAEVAALPFYTGSARA
ncbi:MAG: glycine cleavage system aminomethyltransferase GcvT [Deltaproteobacteria bacterium]|jgi:aminomethyltransferase|nr:glycine cleavage system aminomethyltransferase GcvT [Deltaproteobacteria bacterium]